MRLFQYDSGEYRLSVMSVDNAISYSVVYQDQMSQNNKDEILGYATK